MVTVARRQALGALLDGRSDGVLVTNAVNVRYLSGFTGSNGVLLVRSDGSAVLGTDGRYATQAESECPDVDLHIGRSLGRDLLRLAAAMGCRRVGVELHHLTVTAYDALRAAAEDIELVDAERPVERLRIRKDAVELATLAVACRITDEVFAAALDQLSAGLT